MSAFDDWHNESIFNRFSVKSDLEQAFNAGMEAAAKIASDDDTGGCVAGSYIADTIRTAVKDA